MRSALKKKRSRFAYCCQACGHVASKWAGRCPQCAEWNSLVEEPVVSEGPKGRPRSQGHRPTMVSEISGGDDRDRIATQVSELDRVLGGGLVPGSMVLLGGDPGVGKSTLLCHLLAGVCRQEGMNCLFVSGEESMAQTAMRVRRIGAEADGIAVLAETHLETILKYAEELRPSVLAVDSIQTVHTDALDSIPGSVGQVRECAARLLEFAKRTGTPTIAVGHVTKDGTIAGPKTLEHVVDAVLHFEGERTGPYRVIRAIKNRFGSTQEIGVFEMRADGLSEVENPSALFLAERPLGVPGSVVVASAEGSRPILVEVQALVAPPSAGVGRRTAAGVDGNRVALLLAVLCQRAACDLLARDVFVNVAGGVKIVEPAVDLAIACALASSGIGKAIDARTLVFGEVGLAGEVRGVSLVDVRLAEAQKLGFTTCILPAQNASRVKAPKDLQLIGVEHLSEALAAISHN